MNSRLPECLFFFALVLGLLFPVISKADRLGAPSENTAAGAGAASDLVTVNLEPEQGAIVFRNPIPHRSSQMTSFLRGGASSNKYSSDLFNHYSEVISVIAEKPHFHAHTLKIPGSAVSASSNGSNIGGAPGSSEIEVVKHKGWLVTLFEPQPLAAAQAASRSKIDPHHIERLVAEKAAEITRTIKVNRPNAEVTGQFFKVISALHIVGVELDDLRLLKQNGLIEDFAPNMQVKASLQESLPLVRAEEAWGITGSKGGGVRIGILDTGVDYSHHAFGGCSRQDYLALECDRVKGGFDFYDNDSDPMDCNGHGTHVAGIAGGAGLLPGMAPDAEIVPIRVLGCDGFGYDDMVLAGIEYSMDPNGDGDFSDHLEVINFSLGRFGNPDDVLSRAVNAASDIGVVSVAAAGNFATDYAILSPGIARSAITVGALNRSGALAWFSARGPASWRNSDEDWFFAMKPDLIAPGDPVCAPRHADTFPGSLCNGTNYVSRSGTSVATPHVAGIAAIVLANRPDLQPIEVKELIKAHAATPTVDISLHGQGFGVADAASAVTGEVPIIVSLDPLPLAKSRYLRVSTTISSPEPGLATFSYANWNNINSPRPEDWTVFHRAQVGPGSQSLSASLDLVGISGFDRYVRVEFTSESRRTGRDYGYFYFSLFDIVMPSFETFNQQEPIVIELEHSEELSPSDARLFFRNQYDPDEAEWQEALGEFERVNSRRFKFTVPAGSLPDKQALSAKFLVSIGEIVSETLHVRFRTDSQIMPGFPLSVRRQDESPLELYAGSLTPMVGKLLPGGTQVGLQVMGDPPFINIYSPQGELLSSFATGNSLYSSTATSALVNADQDPELEIAVLDDSTLSLRIYNADGSSVPGWPVTLPSGIVAGSLSVYNAPGNQDPILIVTGNSGRATHLYSVDGQLIRTLTTGSECCTVFGPTGPTATRCGPYHYEPPIAVIADLDSDCFQEIIVLSDSYDCGRVSDRHPHVKRTVSVYDFMTGALERSWDIPSATHRFLSSLHDPLIWDLDLDGRLEIAVADNTGNPNHAAMFLYDAQGMIKDGWPVDIGLEVYPEIVPIRFPGAPSYELAISVFGTVPVFNTLARHLKLVTANGDVRMSIGGSDYSSIIVGSPRSAPSNAFDTALFLPFYNRLVAIDHSGGINLADSYMATADQVAVRDIDGEPGLEVIATGPDRIHQPALYAFYSSDRRSNLTHWPEYRKNHARSGGPPTAARLRCRQALSDSVIIP